MDIKEAPKVIWIAIFIGIVCVLITTIEIYTGEFKINDPTTIADTILGLLAFGLIYRIRFFYLAYIFLIALKVIAGIAFCVMLFTFTDFYDPNDQTIIIWFAGLTILWLVFYIALRRPNVKAWYRTGSNQTLQPSAKSGAG